MTKPRTDTYHPWGQAYLKTWNPARMIFQARNTDGSWAPVNDGLFEGNTTTYAFDEPHDGLGLVGIYGDTTVSARSPASTAYLTPV